MCVCDSVRGGAGASVQDRVGRAEARRRQGVWHEGRGEGQEGAGSRATARRRDSPERPQKSQKSGADGGCLEQGGRTAERMGEGGGGIWGSARGGRGIAAGWMRGEDSSAVPSPRRREDREETGMP